METKSPYIGRDNFISFYGSHTDTIDLTTHTALAKLSTLLPTSGTFSDATLWDLIKNSVVSLVFVIYHSCPVAGIIRQTQFRLFPVLCKNLKKKKNLKSK